MRRLAIASLLACSSAEPPVATFPAGFRFGADTSAYQVEGGNTADDWHQFETLPAFRGKTVEPAGAADDDYTRFDEDVRLAADLGIDVYRLSLEWSRIEPARGRFDADALAHYRAVLQAVRDRGLRASVTLHHFTNPTWVQDLTDVDCANGPSDANLCGWSNPDVATAFAEFVARVATEYGDLVDEWVTINEPNVLVLGGYVFGAFPPARSALTVAQMQQYAIPALRTTLAAHAAAYDAIHAHDNADADGDGVDARVGIAISAMALVGARGTPEDAAAAERATYLYNDLHADALTRGGLDTDFDQMPDEMHTEWLGRLDFLSYQYYGRIAVVDIDLLRPLHLLPCAPQISQLLGEGAAERLGCPTVPQADLTQMGYEHFPDGIADVGRAWHARYPGVPLLVSENGIATLSGTRRAQSVVRHLRALAGLLDEGVAVEGYYHWSLLDNFEWAEGYRPRFGLYSVDFATQARTLNEGGAVYRDVVRARAIGADPWQRYGQGPMAPRPAEELSP